MQSTLTRQCQSQYCFPASQKWLQMWEPKPFVWNPSGPKACVPTRDLHSQRFYHADWAGNKAHELTFATPISRVVSGACACQTCKNVDSEGQEQVRYLRGRFCIQSVADSDTHCPLPSPRWCNSRPSSRWYTWHKTSPGISGKYIEQLHTYLLYKFITSMHPNHPVALCLLQVTLPKRGAVFHNR